ncbi:peptidase C1B, bleomycin hydrolase, partial [Fomitiporia mediterranea MF3/22]|uniref:peptidase C1B, bleomycin hydrolase n=1 Tax=Fomitiporia mediterranea (strain MF3/22) TaxID=694068 RepID=UPI000440963E
MSSPQSTSDHNGTKFEPSSKQRPGIKSHAVKSSEPILEDGSLTLEAIREWENKAAQDPKVQLARTVFVNTNFKDALVSRDTRVVDPYVFNLLLDFKPDQIADQKSTGRCWLFAATNVWRYSFMQELGLKEFQPSQSYLFFWDKLNRCNYYLEWFIKTADLPLDNRLMNFMTDDILTDVGQWDLAINLLEMYGIVPQSIYPESVSSSSSYNISKLLKPKVLEDGLTLRRLVSSLRGTVSEDVLLNSARRKKEELMAENWNILTTLFGVPPMPTENFTWEYYDKDGRAKAWNGTSLEFYRTIPANAYPVNTWISLVNDPRNEYKKLLTVERFNNVIGGRRVLHINTNIDDLKTAVVNTLKSGQPVYVGCDIHQYSDQKSGILDIDYFRSGFAKAFNVSLNLTKAEWLQMNHSRPSHAMIITGAHIDPITGKATRYKAETSWQTEKLKNGFHVLTDAWFDEFVYQVVVPKSLVRDDLVKVFEEGETIVLPPWDQL